MSSAMIRTGPYAGLLVLSALLAAPAPAPAAEPGEYRFSVTPLLGYRMGGNFESDDTDAEVSLDDGAAFGFILNAPAEAIGDDAYTEWELYFSRQSAGIDDAPAAIDPALDVDISYLLLGGTYVGPGQLVRPFLAAGIGAAHLSPDSSGYDSDTVFAFGIGGGAQLFPTEQIGVRLEVRALGAVLDSDSSIFCRSGPEGSACLVGASGDVLWQWEVFAGLVARF
ncbi:MAG: outer membrane beta-barrel protein [Gammaproteobacteria bacterium]|nr:outer membrane beta-barrel protein [Gammaproteobacteria bacterium]